MGTGTGSPEKLWLPLPLKHSRPGWMELWSAWSIAKCPCPWQGVWKRMIFKVSSNAEYSLVLQSYKIVQKAFISVVLFCWWRNGGIRGFSLFWKSWFQSHLLALQQSKVAKHMKMPVLKLHSCIRLCQLFPVLFRVQPCYHDMLTDVSGNLGQKLFSSLQWFT